MRTTPGWIRPGVTGTVVGPAGAPVTEGWPGGADGPVGAVEAPVPGPAVPPIVGPAEGAGPIEGTGVTEGAELAVGTEVGVDDGPGADAAVAVLTGSGSGGPPPTAGWQPVARTTTAAAATPSRARRAGETKPGAGDIGTTSVAGAPTTAGAALPLPGPRTLAGVAISRRAPRVATRTLWRSRGRMLCRVGSGMSNCSEVRVLCNRRRVASGSAVQDRLAPPAACRRGGSGPGGPEGAVVRPTRFCRRRVLPKHRYWWHPTDT
ncbi:conserved hypothetical protein [Frankia sp. Hr75.2]|nr:conserved hypothetical protein [Frankia sp. Hr75.2]